MMDDRVKDDRVKTVPTIIRHVPDGHLCCDPQWEAAYQKFETPEEEVAKFTRRLKQFGFDKLSRDACVAEIFCGRGNGLVALERMGFKDLEGIDLSPSLLEQYKGSATLRLADCLDLPLESDTYDVVIVQGGLHHLPQLPSDLEKCLQNVRRVLKSDGRFYVVEPWLTPFLRLAHRIVENSAVRKVYAKGDALAEMIEHERVTYEQWLQQPRLIREVIDRYFKPHSTCVRWGKLTLVASPRK